jgi:gp16 family phage-associated protein
MNKNSERVLNEFKARGVAIAAWARGEGFNPDLVYRVLRSKSLPLRGQSHLIALKLGLKQEPSESTVDFSKVNRSGNN